MEVLVELGRVQFHLRDFRAAGKQYRAAVNIPPAAAAGRGAGGKDLAVEARHMLGVCLASVGETQSAVGWYDKALKLDPGHREALTNKAQGLRELANDPPAREAYRHGIGSHFTLN